MKLCKIRVLHIETTVRIVKTVAKDKKVEVGLREGDICKNLHDVVKLHLVRKFLRRCD